MESQGLSAKANYEGKCFSTNRYGIIRIIKYYNHRHVMIEFVRTGTYCSANISNIKKGQVADPFAEYKLIYGYGYVGIGKYRKQPHKKAYDHWISMLSRCYNLNMHTREPAYMGCTVCSEWLCFQNFAEWYYKQIDADGFALDKDVIVKGNKTYGPEFCALIPKQINNLFEKRLAKRGLYPIGVYRSDQCTNNPFVARCKDFTGRTQHLGCFSSAIEAFTAYKTFKENVIKEKANQFKSVLDPRVYDAMMKYEVEITD